MPDDQIDLTPDPADLAYQQAVKYGKDLARIYVAERNKRETLEVAYQVLDAVFNNTPDSVVVLDHQLRIQQTNKAFQNLVELHPSALDGQPIAGILPDAVSQAIKDLTENANAPRQIEFTMLKPVQRAILANLSSLKSGGIRGWIITLQDQSNRKRIDYQKSEFINIASHELFTPLGQVLGYSELLRDSLMEDNTSNEIKPTYIRFLESILRSGQHLKSIVDELLQFAVLNSGHTEPDQVTEVKVIELIQTLVTDLQKYQHEKKVTVIIGVSESNLKATLNPALLHTALYQIVLNGITFNKPGGLVRIHAAQKNEQLCIDITDSGIGIAKTDLDGIFQPFIQVEDHNTRSNNGLGLGLSIAQRSIANMSGTLSVESVLGQGSVFHIQVPIYQESVSTAITPKMNLQEELTLNQQQTMAYARDMQALYLKFKHTNEQLVETNTQLEEANRLKSNFLGLISHELRTPFVSIDFALQVFHRYGTGYLHPQQRQLLNQMIKNFKEARQMIDHLIAYAGLLSKQGHLTLQQVDLAGVIDENINILTAMARNRGVALIANTGKPVILAKGDREYISEALWHIMHNAIKFTLTGGQVVIETSEQDGYLVLQVTDTGVGIPVDQQARVWNAFSQSADSLARGVEGLGLGLSLVHYVMISHGGKVTLTSKPGEGSTFGLWFPSHI